ncbi:helix-turn-helix domain-containing protein [Pseudoruminococcus massiliensis]|uniref:helix-turn-helix domain-containing protein n=1 Tax=Pseudoruminococcus massiliensis TaxID=2086583 RepID=UPI003AB50506
MAVSYKKLFHLMIEKEISNVQLQHKAQISANVITRMKRNQYISLESIESICRALNCNIDEILEFISVDEKKEQ